MNGLSALDVFREAEFLYPLIAGAAIAVVASLISVLVALKRLAFIGQGITHAGFGGVGLAAFLGLGGLSGDLVVFLFCVVTGVSIGWLSRNRRLQIDTAIGIVLVAAMALGILLAQLRLPMRQFAWYRAMIGEGATGPLPWEAILFGNILYVNQADMWLAILVGAILLGLLALLFKEIVFYAFDEPVSSVFGVPVAAIHYGVLVALAILIVLAMKLAGLILVNALLVIPGATATLLSRRLSEVLWTSLIVGEIGMVGGYLLSFQILGGQLPTGPFIVLLLSAQFAAALVWNRWQVR